MLWHQAAGPVDLHKRVAASEPLQLFTRKAREIRTLKSQARRGLDWDDGPEAAKTGEAAAGDRVIAVSRRLRGTCPSKVYVADPTARGMTGFRPSLLNLPFGADAALSRAYTSCSALFSED
ncbi:MAG: hypothetical protein AAF526_01370 [Pseudomonadota bacterium]